MYGTIQIRRGIYLRDFCDICCLISPNPWARWWRMSAITGSALLHALVFAGFMQDPGSPQLPRYRVQVLHLEPPESRTRTAQAAGELWQALQQGRKPGASPRNNPNGAGAGRSALQAKASRRGLAARQTLIVDDAPA